ncbi:T9SS type A sorting domain-containing protein [Flavicella sediminum]|uniref:T9SS type A sorting domain-containing protein n=1 Tax=Flavicella sediminum TaxID=2585141 RepID=UPI0011209CED|nr:T9SS type A sorting domain-containing protein [Flavicella sediminum]
MKNQFSLLISLLSFLFCFSQNNLTTVNQDSFDNYTNSYNYTYWNNNWKSSITGDRSFTNYSSSYSLNINYDKLSINSLLVNDQGLSRKEGFSLLNSAIFPSNYKGDIDYKILQNGAVAYDKSSTPTNSGTRDSQMAEYGVWTTRRFVSTNFNGTPPVNTYHTGIDFTNWHNRFKITFHLKPTENITNGQLQLSFTIPAEYTQYYNSGQLHAYALNNKGFVVKGGVNAESVSISGNKITVTNTQQNLIADTAYQISIVCAVFTDNLDSQYTEAFQDEQEISITASQTTPVNQEVTAISYDANEAIHYIDIPRYGMGYNNCATTEQLQSIDLVFTNATSKEKRTKLCFRQLPAINVVGFNSIICNKNGDPSGLPLQVSKNWHDGTSQFYSGAWIKEYTEIIIPANTTLSLVYKRTGAKWGETYSASSHQLSVVGSGVPRGGWLEAALGSFGENMTHSPDYEFGNTIGADLRPFLVTNEAYGGTSKECGWTGNVGGIDFLIYEDGTGTRNYHAQVKTDFKAYSPNLTETSISAVSEDQKLKFDYTFYLNRSDDFTRLYYKITVEALENTAFNRFDIFQLGGDFYNVHNAQSIVYGNDTGLIGQFTPTNNGSNNYTTSEIALTGENPWLWAGDGLYYNGADSGIEIDTNNGMIIRNYTASFNGTVNNTPYLMERSSSKGFSANQGTNPTSYCLVTPPEITSFIAGDKIELVVEVAVLPKQEIDYYGPNQNFSNALATYGNSYEVLYREALGNKITAASSTNTINSTYPLTIETFNNTAQVTLTGGRGYVPIVFSGLSSVSNPILWKSYNNCWELVDQSLHGKDFWQVNYNPETELFDLVYNVNQDITGDGTAVIKYYLGTTPPQTTVVVQSRIDDEAWTTNANLEVNTDTINKITFGPALKEHGISTQGTNENWQWAGPNNFTKTGRAVVLTPITKNDFGAYTVTYTDAYNCTNTATYTISEAPKLGITKIEKSNFTLAPIPVKTHLFLSEENLKTEIVAVKIYTTLGQVVKLYGAEHEFNVSDLASGTYIFSATFQDGTIGKVHFVKTK